MSVPDQHRPCKRQRVRLPPTYSLGIDDSQPPTVVFPDLREFSEIAQRVHTNGYDGVRVHIDEAKEQHMSTAARWTVGIVVVLLVGALGATAFASVRSEGPTFGLGGRGFGGWHERGGWDGDGPGPGWRFGPDPERVIEARSELAEELAAELQTSADEVEEAFRAVAASRVAEAVDAGDLSEEDAADVLSAYDDGDVGALFRILKQGGRGAVEQS